MLSCRKYSEEQVAQAMIVLDQNGGNEARTSRLIDVPRKTLHHWKISRNDYHETEHQEAIETKYHQLKRQHFDRDVEFINKAQELQIKLLDKLSAMIDDCDDLSEINKALLVTNETCIALQYYLFGQQKH